MARTHGQENITQIQPKRQQAQRDTFGHDIWESILAASLST